MKKNKALYLLASIIISGILACYLPTFFSAIFGLYFSIFLPGLLVYLLIKKQFNFKWENFLYVIGLGIVSLIFTSLVANGLLKSLGIARPLSATPIFIAVGIFNLLILIIGYRRWDLNPLTINVKSKLTKYDWVALIAPVILLFGFVAGAMRLNNGASGSIAIACYFLAVLLVINLFVFYKKVKIGLVIWNLWLIALGILLSSWLRGSYVNGIDVVREFQIFELVKHAGYWSIGLYRNAYTACLSVSLLPVSLSYFTKIPDAYIFKLVIPALYSLIVPVVFLIARSQVKMRLAIVATFFFFAQPPFTIWWWIPIRQEVGFLFFALLIMLFVKQPKTTANKILFLLFGVGMIVSHYSTSYIAVGLLLVFYIIQWLRKFLNKKDIDLHFARLPYILVFLLFTFFWYSQATTGFNNVTQYFSKSIQNIGSLFSSDVQQQGQTPFSHFNIFGSAGSAPMTPLQYVEQKNKQAHSRYSSADLYNVNYSFEQAPYQPINSPTAQNLNLLRNILKVLGNLLVSLGVIIVAVLAWKNNKLTNIIWLQISALILFAVALFLPFFSLSYGEDRLYLQFLIVASCGIGTYASFKFLGGKTTAFVQFSLLVFALIYFLFLNQIPQRFTNSSQQNFALSSTNEQYYLYNIWPSDVFASQWLSKVHKKATIYGDNYSQYRLLSGGGMHFGSFAKGVFPDSLPRKSYVYQDASNSLTNTAFDSYQGVVSYKFPVNFLESQKNTIYSNNLDKIYR